MEHLDSKNTTTTTTSSIVDLNKNQNTQNNQDNSNNQSDSETKKYKFDLLQLYFAEPYSINEKIIIKQPTLNDIIKIGENRFYSTLYVFILNTTSYRLQLWDMGKDWNKVSDFELFTMLIGTIDDEVSKVFFGDIDFHKFVAYKDTRENKITLYNEEQDIQIDEETYEHISNYLRTMFNIFPKVEKAKGKTTKALIIEEEREKRKAQELEERKNGSVSTSSLLPMISSYLNHAGTKYKKDELREIGIYEFMDGIQRLQIYESTTALMKGMYSGMVDTKNLDKDALNFMREI